jgi:hypothetical protein
VAASDFTVRVLIRCWSSSPSCSEVDECRERLHRCARSDKTANLLIEGKNGVFTGTSSGSNTVSWTLFDVADGDYDMTVGVQMDIEGHNSGQSTVFAFRVSAARPAYGHDLDLTECAPPFSRAGATAVDAAARGTGAQLIFASSALIFGKPCVSTAEHCVLVRRVLAQYRSNQA